MTSYPLSVIKPAPQIADYLATVDSSQTRWTIADGRLPCVVTGQQVGLFGGPLYTLLKICSAASLSAEISAATGKPSRTVFWLEDVDHDAAEAGSAFVPSESSLLQKRTISASADRLPVYNRTISEQNVAEITQAIAGFDGRNADAVRENLLRVYTVGRSWADCFLDILQPYLDAWNIEVVRASSVLRSGIHLPLVLRDLEQSDLADAIRERSTEIAAQGYSLQAQAPETLFFVHLNGQRTRLHRTGSGFSTPEGRRFTPTELKSIAEAQPECFSPNVMGRPLVQDLYLNTTATVLGMAEWRYQQQLAYAYPLVNLTQPELVLRHHTCLLDAKAERSLGKTTIDVPAFFVPWEELERSEVTALAENLVPDLPAATVEKLIAPYLNAAGRIDVTLEKTVGAAQAAITTALENLSARLRAGLKKKNAESVDRLHQLWWRIYPGGHLNERIFPLALWQARIGNNEMRSFAEHICQHSRHQFHIVAVSDLPGLQP